MHSDLHLRSTNGGIRCTGLRQYNTGLDVLQSGDAIDCLQNVGELVCSCLAPKRGRPEFVTNVAPAPAVQYKSQGYEEELPPDPASLEAE